jgi:hypothetical protein
MRRTQTASPIPRRSRFVQWFLAAYCPCACGGFVK